MLLEIENVFGGYGNGDILKGISCSADYGDVLCLLGPNGCGKTTLFRMILGSLPVSNGKIKIAGKNISDFTTKTLANMIAYIPQYHSPVFAYTVLDIVIMGRASHFSAFETPKEPDQEAAFAALEKTEEAVSAYQELYEDLKDNPEFLEAYVYLLREAGDVTKAREVANQYLAIVPDDVQMQTLYDSL